MLVARRVLKVAETQDEEQRREELPLDNFRMTPAWVLLGEPGAGKSEALKQAALEVDGVYVTVNELINTTPPLEEWREKTLFIDALVRPAPLGLIAYLYASANNYCGLANLLSGSPAALLTGMARPTSPICKTPAPMAC